MPIASAFIKLFKGENDKLSEDRLKICNPCEHRMGILCGNCGCYLKAKVRDPEEECPNKYWLKSQTPHSGKE